jgi:sporulation protein YlmC with PRC-barrel domain
VKPVAAVHVARGIVSPLKRKETEMADWQSWNEDRRRSGRGYARGERFDEPRSFRSSESGWAREPREGYRFGRRDNRRFDNRDEEHRVPRNETDRLIASDKVEGTRVYSRDGERLGTVENFMVDKRSGRVEYAVLSFGGAMGIGDRHYPIPWQMLTYEEDRGGYVVDLTPRDLERAPSHAAWDRPRFDTGYGTAVQGYYGYPF